MANLVQKLLNIKFLLPGILLLCTNYNTNAQVAEFLIPDAAVIQHAGSIGYVSGGVGYNMLKEKGSLDLTYGYVPESKGGAMNIISAKFAYRPFAIKIKDAAVIYPVNPGFFVSYHAGREFNIKWDEDQYPNGYYWWSTAIREHISFSTEIKLNTRKEIPGSKIGHIAFYAEFNTNDLYFVSWFKNPKAISITDIFKSGYGVRMYF